MQIYIIGLLLTLNEILVTASAMKLEQLMEDRVNLVQDIMTFGLAVCLVNISLHVERMYFMMKIGMQVFKVKI